jgi:hypothetical protein
MVLMVVVQVLGELMTEDGEGGALGKKNARSWES